MNSIKAGQSNFILFCYIPLDPTNDQYPPTNDIIQIMQQPEYMHQLTPLSSHHTDNDLGGEAGVALAEALKSCPSLQSLNLSGESTHGWMMFVLFYCFACVVSLCESERLRVSDIRSGLGTMLDALLEYTTCRRFNQSHSKAHPSRD